MEAPGISGSAGIKNVHNAQNFFDDKKQKPYNILND